MVLKLFYYKNVQNRFILTPFLVCAPLFWRRKRQKRNKFKTLIKTDKNEVQSKGRTKSKTKKKTKWNRVHIIFAIQTCCVYMVFIIRLCVLVSVHVCAFLWRFTSFQHFIFSQNTLMHVFNVFKHSICYLFFIHVYICMRSCSAGTFFWKYMCIICVFRFLCFGISFNMSVLVVAFFLISWVNNATRTNNWRNPKKLNCIT